MADEQFQLVSNYAPTGDQRALSGATAARPCWV